MRVFFLFIFLILIHRIFIAQDVHWSQFNDNPLYLNPANSGNFKGDSRFVLNYRDQWRSVTVPFQTTNFSYDAHLKKYPNIGLGLLFLNDVTGDGKFKTFELQTMPSYRKFLTKDSSQQLLSGIQIAFNHRQFTFPNFYFDEQYNGVNYDENAPITEELFTDKKNNLSLGAGLVYQWQKSKKQQYQIGLSAFNINQPNQGFYGVKIKRNVRICFFTKTTINLRKKLDLIPSILYQAQGTYKEFILGSQLKYTLSSKPKDYKAIYGGLFYRHKDVFYLNAGMDYKKWYLGLSYDINISSLKPASGGRGGIEVSARYILYRFKPKQIQHRICPEFI